MSHWFWPAFQREIRSSWKKLSLAALTLCLGMTALTTLLLANSRLETQTRRQADTILGGDLEISDVRPLPEKLLETLQTSPKIARRTRVSTFVSMATLPQSSRPRLIEVLAIDDSYPLVPGMKVRPTFSFEQLRSGGLWIEKSFAQTHSLQVATEKISGDMSDKTGQKLLGERKALRIGKKVFPIVGLVENDQMRDFASFSLGSRLYMAREIAQRQKLISSQSRLRDRVLIQLPAKTKFDSAVEWLRGEINKFESSRPNLRTKEDALNAAFKPARSLFLFFNAIGFAALLLLGLGSAQGIHSYLTRKQTDAQILSNLGAPRPLLTLLYVGNVVVITGFALALGASFGHLLFRQEIAPRLAQWFTGNSGDVSLLSSGEVVWKFGVSAFLLTMSLILPGALIYLRNARQRSSVLDFSTQTDPPAKKIFLGFLALLENFPDLVWLGAALLLSFLISSETGFNLIMVVLLTGVYLTLRVAVLVIGRLGLNPGIRLPLSLRIAGSEIGARPSQSSLTLLLFGLSVCLLVFMWDLRSNIVNQITTATSGMQRPNVFVLDAPPDAMKSVRSILSRGGDEKNILSEKITRARLQSINGKSADEWMAQIKDGTDDKERALRLFNREQNLTSRATVADDNNVEEVVAGKFWSKDSGSVPRNEVSVEIGIAKTLNINLDDVIDFDVQGVPVKVKVTSLRRVRWQSFRPNFFFVLHPSTLTDAPFSGLFATNLPETQTRQDVLNSLFENHPGITALDATELAELAGRLLTAALDIVRFLTILLFAGALLNTLLSAWTSYSLRARNF